MDRPLVNGSHCNPDMLIYSSIRDVTVDDIEWVMGLVKSRYLDNDYDEAGVRAWLVERLKEPTMHFVRGEHSAGCCHLGKRYMAPSRWQAYLTVIASTKVDHLSMEPFRIFENLVEWAREKGATKFWAADVTGFDLGSFVKKLGGQYAGSNYVIDLDGQGGRYG